MLATNSKSLSSDSTKKAKSKSATANSKKSRKAMSNAQKAIKDPADPVGIPLAPMAIAPSAPVKEEDTAEIAADLSQVPIAKK